MSCKLLMCAVVGLLAMHAAVCAECPPESPTSPVTVTGPYAANQGAWKFVPDLTVSLRSTVTLCVPGLEALMAGENSAATKSRIVLFIDDHAIPGLTPDPRRDPKSGALSFTLTRDAKSLEVWKLFLGRPTFESKPLSISVGAEDGYAQPSSATIRLSTIPLDWFWTWAVLVALLVVAFLLLAVRSNLLRDIGPEPGFGRKQYSLAKTQAMWWFFLVLSSYLFIGLVTGDYGSAISNTALALIGISAATTLGGSVIDSGVTSGLAAAASTAAQTAQSAAANAARASEAANAANAAAVVTPTATHQTAAIAAASAAQVASTVAQSAVSGATIAAATAGAPARAARPHWWLDILSDNGGVSFHRFQMAAWTVVLGVIFVHDVYIDLAMPTFDSTLLGLLGISSGTYLGLKATSET